MFILFPYKTTNTKIYKICVTNHLIIYFRSLFIVFVIIFFIVIVLQSGEGKNFYFIYIYITLNV